MEIKIKSLGCIITGGGGVDPIDAFGQFVYDRLINVCDSFNTSQDNNATMFLYKGNYAYGEVRPPKASYFIGLSFSGLTGNGSSFGYELSVSSDGSFKYKALNAISTSVRGTDTNVWVLSGPNLSSTEGIDMTDLTPVTKENLLNFKAFLDSHPEIDLTEFNS